MLHLNIKQRDKTTKAKKLLREGKLPGVVYGPKTKPLSVEVDYKEFIKLYEQAGETTLIALDDKNTADARSVEDNVVLIRDAHMHPISQRFIHVDFYQLPLDKPIEITVPIEGAGLSPAVKDGAVLVHNLREITIKALPKNLIHELIVDLSKLASVGDHITVADLPRSKDIEILASPQELVFMIEEPQEEVLEPEAEVTETEKIEAIKTEGEEKREEKAAEASAEEEK